MGRQSWIADAPRRWGLDVIEVDGWQTRGSDSFSPRGLVAHHTAGPSGGGDLPSLNTLVHGRPDLDGPLCNWGLGRSGTVYVIAAGRANHAGSGGWRGLSGNSSVLGIEAENDGFQPWPADQIDAYGILIAAACDALAIDPGMTCRHHEWRAEKPDPHDIDGDTGRANVARILAAGPGGTDDMPSSPSQVIGTDGREHTLIRGGDGALWHNVGTPSTPASPKGWVRVGGGIASSPSGAPTEGGGLLVAAVGNDGQIFQIRYDGSRWGGWRGIGGGVE